MPQVSVITTVYNAGSYLRDCVESVRDQSFDDWEHVVVDDGSDDDVVATLAPVLHDRLRLVSQGRVGHQAAMNVAIREATGELLAVLDADDLALPNRLTDQVAFLATHPDIELVGSRHKVLCDASGSQLRTVDLGVETNAEARRALLRGQAATSHSSVMMRRSFVEASGGYDEALLRGSDRDLISKAVAAGSFANVPGPVAWKRIHDGQYFRLNRAGHGWRWRNAARRHLYFRVVDRLGGSRWHRLRFPWLILRSGVRQLQTGQRTRSAHAPDAAD